MQRLKNAGLVFCLFIVLIVIFRCYFRANEAGTFFGALAGTPLLVHIFNRVVPTKESRAGTRAYTAEVIRGGAPVPLPADQVFVLRVERHNGRAGD